MRTRQSIDHSAPRRLFLAACISLGVLFLGAYVTSAAWTTAVITNDQNTTRASGAVALRESASGTTCQDTATTPGNSAVCPTINKYGGTPLVPGDYNVTEVTLTNTGTRAGNLSLIPGGCTKSGGLASSTANLCERSWVQVTCSSGGLGFFSPSTPQTLNFGRLEAGASMTCDVQFQVLVGAPASVSGQSVSQPLTWRLQAV